MLSKLKVFVGNESHPFFRLSATGNHSCLWLSDCTTLHSWYLWVHSTSFLISSKKAPTLPLYNLCNSPQLLPLLPHNLCLSWMHILNTLCLYFNFFVILMPFLFTFPAIRHFFEMGVPVSQKQCKRIKKSISDSDNNNNNSKIGHCRTW